MALPGLFILLKPESHGKSSMVRTGLPDCCPPSSDFGIVGEPCSNIFTQLDTGPTCYARVRLGADLNSLNCKIFTYKFIQMLA